jgi:hypothetical protein
VPTQVAVVYVPAGEFDEKYAYAAIAYCRSRGYFPAAVVHGDWRTVDLMLAEHLAQTVIVARHEHGADRWSLGDTGDVAPVANLDRRRAEAETRRLTCRPNDATGRRLGGCQVGRATDMTTSRVVRILSGEEAAPPEFDAATVEAIRSVASKVRALDSLIGFW